MAKKVATTVKVLSIADFIKDPRNQVDRTFVVFDIAGSTKLKEINPLGWMTVYGVVFDVMSKAIIDAGVVPLGVKYTGDGAMFIFGDDDQEDAVRFAVAVQEQIWDSRSIIRDVACSCGISSGKAYPIKGNRPEVDYVGQAVDLAFRLCSAVKPFGILMDVNTLHGCAPNSFRSRFGETVTRDSNEYHGTVQTTKLRGFSDPVQFYELLWHRDRFGLKEAAPLPTAPDTRSAAVSGDPEFVRAQITNVQAVKGFCFARDESNQDHFVANTSFVDGVMPRVGDVAYIVPGLVNKVGASPPASTAIVVGQTYRWRVVNAPIGEKFVFLKFENATNAPNVFGFVGDANSRLKLDDVFEWPLQENLRRKSPVLQLADMVKGG